VTEALAAPAGAPARRRRGRGRLTAIAIFVFRSAAVLLAVTFGTFMIVQLLPGDPARALLGEGADDEQVEALREELGLSDPLLTQYVHWVGDAATGDLGQSNRTKQDVSEAIAQRLPVSLELMVLAQVGALTLAVPAALRAAYRPRSRFDTTASGVSYGLLAMPSFLLAIVLIYVFAVKWGVLPSSGFVRLTQNPWQNLRSLVLPAATLALTEAPVYYRLLRSEVQTTLSHGFVDLALAKGVSERRVLWRHALRPSSLSLVTLAGINIARLIGGTVIVESIFALPGIGQMMVSAIYNRDLITLQGAVLVVGVAFIVTNSAVDLLYPVIDPRLRKAHR
jgi:peptide/nickel transport system permease protein